MLWPRRYNVDETLIDRLHDFLNGDKQTLSIRLDDLSTDVAEFDRQLVYFTRPGKQQQLRIYKAEREIMSALPGSVLSIQQSAKQGVAVLNLPWIGSAFLIDPSEQEKVRALVFEQGALPYDVPSTYLNPVLREALNLVDGAMVLRGAIDWEAEPTVRLNSQQESASFQLAGSLMKLPTRTRLA